MRPRSGLLTTAFLAFSLFLATGLRPILAQQKPKIPADFTFPQEKGSLGKVTFSHEKHHEKNPKCTDCHTEVFKMKKGTSRNLTMAAMNKGESCGVCHDGKKAFGTKDEASCTKCHVKG